MTRYKLINSERIKFTAEEEAQRDAEEAQGLIDIENEKQTIENEKAKKASGKQKLKDLGLDDDEIKALMGVE
jgi:hypothetical protein